MNFATIVRRLALCVILSVVLTVPQTSVAFQDGRELLDAAEAEDTFTRNTFTAYVTGVVHGTLDTITALRATRPDIARPFCFGSQKTYKDAADAVREWLRQQPNFRHYSAHLSPPAKIIIALHQRFPCKAMGERP